MRIIGNDLTIPFISVLGHHLDSLERKMHIKQPLKTGRLVEDEKGNNCE